MVSRRGRKRIRRTGLCRATGGGGARISARRFLESVIWRYALTHAPRGETAENVTQTHMKITRAGRPDTKASARWVTVEKALRESERKFGDFSEKSLVGIYLIQHGLFRYVNPRFAEIFRYDVKEVVDKKSPRDLVAPGDEDMVEESIRRRLSGEIKSVRYEFLGLTKDRRAVSVEVYASRTQYQGE